MMSVVRIMLIVTAVFITDNVLAKNTLEQKLINASRVKRSYYGHCYNMHTWFTYDGNGNTVYLDRQSPNCGLFAMRSFHLVRNNGNDHVRYDISCCHLPKKLNCQTSTRHTAYNNEGSGNMVYLDRHRVSCPYNGFLKHFHLNRNHNLDRYRYTYSCCIPQSSQRSKMSCYTSKTRENNDGGGDMVYLDRHTPRCHFGFFLNRFELVRPSSRTIQYKYRCCAF